MVDLKSILPPHSIEAEKAVLGSMILYPQNAELGVEKLTENFFYDSKHKTIFNGIVSLIRNGRQVDILTVADVLKKNDELEKIGGFDYLTQLVESVIAPVNFLEHVKIIEDTFALRRVIELSYETIQQAASRPGDVRKFIDQVEAKFFQLAQYRIKSDFTHIRAIVSKVHEDIVSWHKEKKLKESISTGYKKLDELLAGFHPSDYIVVAGRTGSGKTAFALSITRRIAVLPEPSERRPVAIFSLEMDKEQLAKRLIAAEAKVDAHKMRRGILSKGEINKIALAVKKLSDAPIYVDDSPAISLLDLRSKARRLARQVNLGLIIVDYLQLMTPIGRADTRQEEVASISRGLKALAKELNVPIMALAQLSRRAEESPGARPKLSHLRESGAIEQDADVVLLIYRPEIHGIETINVYGRQMDSHGIANIIVAKQRNGPTGDVFLAFHKEFVSFEPLEIPREEEVPSNPFVDYPSIDDEFGGV